MPDLSLPPGVVCHEGEDARLLTPTAGLESAHELPRFEVFGDAERLAALATTFAPSLVGEEPLLAQLSLSRLPVEDPSDRGQRHLLRLHAHELFARDALWRRLFAEGVRAYRWLQPHWRWDRWCYGVLVGPAPLATVEAAVKALWDETADRLVWLEPPGTTPDPEVRAFLRGKAEVLLPGAAATDADAPAARLETAVTLVDAAVAESDAEGQARLARAAHRLVVAPHPTLGLLTEGEAPRRRAGGTLRLAPDKRHLLAVGPLASEGQALVLEPESGTARWIRIG